MSEVTHVCNKGNSAIITQYSKEQIFVYVGLNTVHKVSIPEQRLRQQQPQLSSLYS